ncbi:hypothetical protein [Streptomyces cylindrosporus]|uniref:Uncharacterized protein n=1 Tax=Streptomyces cylindrosporus TaxID=2927583 RepID=A0ABS9YGC6_9ACTN|nr:hypothetical protein [Streptomyces cylindrosporus]MCI3276249.1 hypothetical protein [Streptomyces cylindrosporus]
MSTPTLPRRPRPTLASVTAANVQLRRQLAALWRDHDELLAAARTAVSAFYDGAPLPLAVLIDTLDRLGAAPEYAPQLTEAALAAVDGQAPALSGRRIA